jgi:hypothetical protein
MPHFIHVEAGRLLTLRVLLERREELAPRRPPRDRVANRRGADHFMRVYATMPRVVFPGKLG